MWQTMLDFKHWYGMPSVHGAIDCTHISISKPAAYPEITGTTKHVHIRWLLKLLWMPINFSLVFT
jgi:hypothetical protein